MDLSIIIVSWNVKEKLRENLKAINQSKGNFSFEIFVVDNNSQDGTAEMVRNEFRDVKLIANRENFGFARANNQAIKEAQGDFILLLNPDMKVFSDTLFEMVKWAKSKPSAWAVGCLLVDENNNVIKQARRFPSLIDQLAIVLKIPHIFPKVLNNYLLDDFNYSQPSVVDSLRGGFFLVRRETINKVGLLDEQFFLWFEEVDYCLRIKKAGGEVWYTPAAQCIDFVGQSFRQLPRGQAQRYFRDSQLKYFKKWRPGWQYILLKICWPVGLALTWLGGALKFRRRART